MKLMDTSSLILFIDFIPEYKFIIKLSESGEVMIITPEVEIEYCEKIEYRIDSYYNLNNLLTSQIIIKERCKINDIFKKRYFNLGSGEKSIMSLALEYKKQNKEYYCVLDDKNARNVAKNLGLNVKGSIGLILLLKEKGIIENPKELYNKIIKSPFRISDDILEVLNA